MTFRYVAYCIFDQAYMGEFTKVYGLDLNENFVFREIVAKLVGKSLHGFAFL